MADRPQSGSALSVISTNLLATLVRELDFTIEGQPANIRARHLRSCLIDVLIGGAFPIPEDGRSFLRPLWQAEALNRATNILCLVERLDSCTRSSLSDQDMATARTLADAQRSLCMVPESARLPTARVLNQVVCGLAGLFGRVLGSVNLTVDIVPLALTPFRRRALVLLASELVTQALLHGSRDNAQSRINVLLTDLDSRNLRLLVEHNACRPDVAAHAGKFEIISKLAALLEAELVYHQSELSGTSTELVFPA